MRFAQTSISLTIMFALLGCDRGHITIDNRRDVGQDTQTQDTSAADDTSSDDDVSTNDVSTDDVSADTALGDTALGDTALGDTALGDTALGDTTGDTIADTDSNVDAGPCANVDCSNLDGVCVVGVCNPSDGTCSAQMQADDTPCNTQACSPNQTCQSNACMATPTVAPLNVLDDGSTADASLPDLVMSEINPGNYIELYNNTNTAIALSSTDNQLCSPFNYTRLASLAPTVSVPPRGFAIIPWPSNFNDTPTGGEIILYANGAFGDAKKIEDFVCWGTNPHGSRKTAAEGVGKWSGACAAAASMGAVHRNASTTGTTAADYDVTSVGTKTDQCEPTT